MKTKDLKTILWALILAGALPFLTSCEDDDDGGGNGNPSVVALDSGFLIISNGDGNRFARYTPGLPSGTFDVAAGQSFADLLIRDQFGNEFFGNSISVGNGVEKFIVNESGLVETDGFVVTEENPFPITIADPNTGYYSDENDLTQLFIFDPSTMQQTGSIDLSSAFFTEAAPDQNYGGLTIRGNDMFLPYRPRNGDATPFYDSLIYHVLDRTTNTYVKTIYLPGHVNPRVFTDPYVDEQGNIYHLTDGDLEVPNLIRPSIVKIPAGSTDFDASYDFRFVNAIPGGDQLPLQTADGFYYAGNGIAYVLAIVSVPQSIQQIVVEAGGIQNLTQEELDNVFALLETEPTSAWLRLDLEAQTTTVINDIPLSNLLVDFATEIDGDMYLATSSDAEAAVYRYDPDRQTSTVAFTLSTASGSLSVFYDLSQVD